MMNPSIVVVLLIFTIETTSKSKRCSYTAKILLEVPSKQELEYV
jgi:hypothetical protein